MSSTPTRAEYMKSIAEEIHKPVRKVKQRRKVRVGEKDEIWAMDLVEMKEWKDDNDGNQYLLTVVDVFTRYAWAAPSATKNAVDILAAFTTILDSGRRPKKLWVDQGSEFYNYVFKEWMTGKQKKKGKGKDIENKPGKAVAFPVPPVTMYSTFGESKSVIVERWNRTLKSKMWRYFTEENTRRWVDKLPDLVATYNKTKHSTLGMSPEQAGMMANQKKIYLIHNPPLDREGGRYLDGESRKPKWSIGDVVRISRVKGTFEKGFHPNFSREIFTIVETQVPFDLEEPITYKLKDHNGEILQGSFYDEELGPVKYPDVFLVESTLKEKKVRGKKQYLVKWLGLPSSFNSWVPEEDFIDDFSSPS